MEKGTFDLVLRVLAWGFIITSVLLVILKAAGVLHSPTPLSLETLLTVGILIELGRLETKISLLWADFKKRKLGNN